MALSEPVTTTRGRPYEVHTPTATSYYTRPGAQGFVLFGLVVSPAGARPDRPDVAETWFDLGGTDLIQYYRMVMGFNALRPLGL
jgi:hypothetical protein